MRKTQGIARKSISAALAFTLALSLGFGYALSFGATQAHAADDGVSLLAGDLATLGVQDCGEQAYTGKAVEPYSSKLTLADGTKLSCGEHFTVTYENNVNVGTATAVITGVGEYSGTVEKTFQIVDQVYSITVGDVEVASLTLGDLQAIADEYASENTENLYYQGGGNVYVVPAQEYVTYDQLAEYLGFTWTSVAPTASDGFGTTVTKDIADNGKFYPAQGGADDYTAEGAVSVPAVLALAWVADTEITSTAQVAADGVAAALAAGTVEPEVGTRTFAGIPEDQFNADGETMPRRFVTGPVTWAFEGELAANHIASMGIQEWDAQTYTGSALTPYSGSVKWNVDDTRAQEGTDYTVTYKNNTELGIATAVIQGAGSYTGTMYRTFDIVEFEFSVTANGAQAASFTLSELEALAASAADNAEDVYYQYAGKGGASVVYVPAKSYITYNTLLAAAGIDEWDSVVPAASDGFSTTVTKAIDDEGMFYPAASATSYDATDAVHVPAIISLEYATANVESTYGAAMADAAAAELDPTIRAFAGIPASDFNESGAIGGNRFITGVVTVDAQAGPAPHESITDLPAETWWSYEYIVRAVDAGYVTGYTDGTGRFDPEGTLTRAQVATILYRATVDDASDTTDPSLYATENTTGLSDVQTGQYYTAAVNWAVENGIVTGHLDTMTFDPEGFVSRQDLGTMIGRYAKNIGGQDLAAADPTAATSTLDWGTVVDYAQENLIWTAANGIMEGVDNNDGTFSMNPTDTATRAQMAKIIVTLMDVLG